MKVSIRIVLAAIFVLAIAAGCSKSSTPTANCAEGCKCTSSAQCDAGFVCQMDLAEPVCRKVVTCTSRQDCVTNDARCSGATAIQCDCVKGQCQQLVCSADAQCAQGTKCINGSCETPQAADSTTTCTILTQPTVTRQGQTVQFAAQAKNANGAIVAGQSFTWASSATDKAAVAANTDSAFATVTGGATSGTTDITCKVVGGSATASAAVTITNFADVAAGHARVLVLDEATGQPLQGATVRVVDAGGTAKPDATTDAGGVVDVDITGQTPPQAIHVFHNSYKWVSVYGAGKSDLLVSVAPIADETKAGGFRGEFDFSKIPNPGEVELGIAGASIPGSLINMDFTTLIGEMLTRRIKIGSLVDENIPLPSGITLTLSGEKVKGDYQPFGVPGKRVAWGLGGKVPIAELIRILTPLLSGGTVSVDTLPIGQLLAQIMPFFDSFRHGIKADIDITALDKVLDDGSVIKNPLGSASGTPWPDYDLDQDTTDKVANYQNFPRHDIQLTQPMQLSTSLTPPMLPLIKASPATYLDGVIAIAGALVPGRGLVPLGLGAAVDAAAQGDTPNGWIDTDYQTPGDQKTMNMKFASKHSGIEAGKYLILMLSLSLDFSDQRSNSLSGFVVFPDVTSGFPASVTLPSAFLKLAKGSYNFTTRAMNLTETDAAKTFLRADFTDGDKEWHVYFNGTAFTLPTPPASVATRDPAGSPKDVSIYHVTLSGGKTFSDLMEFNDKNLPDIVEMTERFSNTECKEEGTTANCPE